MEEKFSFKKGWGQVRQKDAKAIKKRIMKALSITTRASWGRYLNGDIEPKISEYKEIEAIFTEYGIKKVWGK
jgi:hypothetical protein